jgi:glutathione S-transferase
MLTIWGHANAPNVRKVVWTCKELGLAHLRHDIGGPFGGTDSPSYLALNPNGRIPTIEDDGFVLWESHAIIRYLAAKDPQARLRPADIRARAIVDQWMDWQSAHLSPAIRALVVLVLKPGTSTPTASQIAAARAGILQLLAILERNLQRHAHVAAEEFTMADIPIAISYNMWKFMEPSGSDFHALESWYERIKARPAFEPLTGGPSGARAPQSG